MLCQDTAGTMPAIHISKEAFLVAQEYEECSKVALLLRIHEWAITFKIQGNTIPSVKVEFMKLFHKLKKHVIN